MQRLDQELCMSFVRKDRILFSFTKVQFEVMSKRVTTWVLEEDGGEREEQLSVVCITVERESM